MSSALSIVMLSGGLFAGQFCPSCASNTMGYSGPVAPAYTTAMPSTVIADAGFGGGTAGQLYPFDNPEPWLHGYFQEIPAYGGFRSFQPYNYRHVFGQVQAASAWGMGAMPYSQQFWHRYADRASLKERATPYAPRNTMPQSRRMTPSANAAIGLAGTANDTLPADAAPADNAPHAHARGEVAPVAADIVAPAGPSPRPQYERARSGNSFAPGGARPQSPHIVPQPSSGPPRPYATASPAYRSQIRARAPRWQY